MFYLRPIRYLAEALTAECSPRQIALGLALGLLVGLVPKGNLTAVALMAVMCSLRVNLAAGLLSAFVVSWAAVIIDPLTHRIGLALLTLEPLTPIWTHLYDLPLLPWTGFNNTVVLGSLVLGVLLFWPSYLLSKPLIDRHGPAIANRLRKYRAVQLLWGADLADSLRRA